MPVDIELDSALHSLASRGVPGSSIHEATGGTVGDINPALPLRALNYENDGIFLTLGMMQDFYHHPLNPKPQTLKDFYHPLYQPTLTSS